MLIGLFCVEADVNQNCLRDYIATSSYAIVYCDGESEKLNKKQSQQVVGEFLDLISDAHEMPAFGVALNDEVVEQKNKGVFVEFCFDDILEYNGMTFSKLLVEVNSEFGGFNLIRYTNGEYSGRCFYISLENKTMKNFYEYIISLDCLQK